MPGKAKFKMDKTWKRLEKQLGKANVHAVVRRNLRMASIAIGAKGIKAIKDGITSASFQGNAPLTIALKGVDEPLIGGTTGAPLFKAFTYEVINDYTVFIGVLKKDDFYNIALFIHEGGAIPVTPEMRGLFASLAAKETNPALSLSERAQELWNLMPGGWKPLSPNTTVITMPPRPFIKRAFNADEFRKFAQKFWNEALAAAMKELGGK